MSPRHIPPGPVLAAIDGLELAAADRERLLHPLVGGVVLFTRNYSDTEQLTRLCLAIHQLREPKLLVCVDHEGGRVQRFRDGYTRLPPMRSLGRLWDRDPARAKETAHAAGFVLAAELLTCGVDLSFAPVLDVDHGASTIIGDRAFHSDPAAIVELAGSLIEGMRQAGMSAVGKHFPGHGYIAADSHLELPVDERSLAAIERCDLIPFRALADKLAGIMPAHVLYPEVDARPAGFSARWLRDILRQELGFGGAIFSDDLGMEGAAGEGSLQARAKAALDAGCDLVLACTSAGADELLAQLRYTMPQACRERLLALSSDAPARCAGSHAGDSRLAAARAALARLQL